MIVNLCWVPKGKAKTVPDREKLEDEQVRAKFKEMQLNGESFKRDDLDDLDDIDDDNEENENNEEIDQEELQNDTTTTTTTTTKKKKEKEKEKEKEKGTDD